MPPTRPKAQPAGTNSDDTPLAPWTKRDDVITGQGLTLDEGVTWMLADDAGLDGRALALAGHAAQPVLRLMRAAAHAKTAAKRTALTGRAEKALRKLNPGKIDDDAYAALVNQVTARITELGLPDSAGGSSTATPSVNPETGLQEFTGQPIWPPPRPGPKPDPDMPRDLKTQLRTGADLYRGILGINTQGDHGEPSLTAQSMQHFLGSSGRDRYIDPSQLRKFETISKAEDENRSWYEQRTFGNWSPMSDTGKLEKAKLDAIQDGQTIDFKDRWKNEFRTPEVLRNFDPDLAFSIGSGSLVSDGRFQVTRNGNTLDVTGTVQHELDDIYDFKDGGFQADNANRLLDGGFAETYRNRSRWSQPMSATVNLLPDGNRKVQKIEWGGVTPYDWKVGD